MQRLGGHIRVTNRSRRGALIELTFPFMTAGGAAAGRRATAGHLPKNRGAARTGNAADPKGVGRGHELKVLAWARDLRAGRIDA